MNAELPRSEMGRPRQLIASERRRQMAELVCRAGALRIDELTEMFGVSDETIRRDFAVLQDQGVLTRLHGGARATGKNAETSYGRRMSEHRDEKERIARMAADLVQDSSTIIIDSGTTMRCLVSQLRTKRDLVVITNGVSNVDELLANPTTTVVITGGLIRRATLGGVGDLAVATLETLRADHTFIATQGFSAEAGLTYPSFEEVAVKRAMVAAGAEVTLLADGSKCGRSSMVQFAPLSAVQRIITTPPIPDEEQDRIADLGIELLVVEAQSHNDGAPGRESGADEP